MKKKIPKKFKNDICNLLKEYNIKVALITDILENDLPKTKFYLNCFDTSTGNELEIFEDTTIEVIEKYFTKLHDVTFLLKIPYEQNKKILTLDKGNCWEYYSPKN